MRYLNAYFAAFVVILMLTGGIHAAVAALGGYPTAIYCVYLAAVVGLAGPIGLRVRDARCAG